MFLQTNKDYKMIQKYSIYFLGVAGFLFWGCSPVVAKLEHAGKTESITHKNVLKSFQNSDPQQNPDKLTNLSVYTNYLNKMIMSKMIRYRLEETKIFDKPKYLKEWEEKEFLMKRNHFFSKNVKPKTILKEVKNFLTSYEVKMIYISHFHLTPLNQKPETKKIIQLLNTNLTYHNFEQMANKYSDLKGASFSGYVRPISEDTPRTNFLKILKQTDIGQFTEPFYNRGNIYIVKILGKENKQFAIQQIVLTNITEQNFSNRNAQARKIYQKLKLGYRFDSAANRYSEDHENFTFGEFPEIDYFSQYYSLIKYLKKYKPGEIIKQIPVITGYIYVKYLKKNEPSPQQIKTYKTNREFLTRLSNRLVFMENQKLKENVVYSDKVKRHYGKFYNQKLKQNTAIIDYRDYAFTYQMITNKLYSKENLHIPNIKYQPGRFAFFAEKYFTVPEVLKIYIKDYYRGDRTLKKNLLSEKNAFYQKKYPDFMKSGFEPKVSYKEHTNYYNYYKATRFVKSESTNSTTNYIAFEDVSNRIFYALKKIKTDRFYHSHLKSLFSRFHVKILTNRIPVK